MKPYWRDWCVAACHIVTNPENNVGLEALLYCGNRLCEEGYILA